MRVEHVPMATLRDWLTGPGIRLDLGYFTVRLTTKIRQFAPQFQFMYGRHQVIDAPGIDDYWIALKYPLGLRRYFGRQVQGYIDGRAAFLPLGAEAALAMWESCLNWCISTSGPSYLLIHAAVLERNGKGIIFPGQSGSGKSTLCAALVASGWRLFSDEIAIIDPADGSLLPVPRPISVKNESIAIVRRLFGDGELSPVFAGMPKGDIAYLRPPASAVARARETAMPAFVVSPTFVAGLPIRSVPLRLTEAFKLIVDNSMNYSGTLRKGFDTVTRLVESCPAYGMSYGNLEDAIRFIEGLCENDHASGPLASELNQDYYRQIHCAAK